MKGTTIIWQKGVLKFTAFVFVFGFLAGVSVSFIFIFYAYREEKAYYEEGYKNGQIDYKQGRKFYRIVAQPNGEKIYVYQPDTTKGGAE
jgi:hypothetical protein